LLAPAGVLVVLALAAGCGAHRHASLGTAAIEDASFHAHPAPATFTAQRLSLEIALVTPTARVDPTEAAALAGWIGDAAARAGGFARVEVVPQEAARQADLRLELAPAACDLADEANDDATASVIGYLFLGPWSNWFHERDARLRFAFGATLRDGATGRVLWRWRELSGRNEDAVSFWERRGGPLETLATVCWIPPMAFDSDRARLLALLGPPAAEGPADAIVATAARLRRTDVEAFRVREFPLEGLAVSVVTPTAATAGGPRQAVIVRLSGEKVAALRTVWIGDAVVYDAALTQVPAGARELLVGRPPAPLPRAGPILVLAKIGDAAPIAIAEIGTARVKVFSP
jgi:hypothetical protein